ncbi:helix-turn-helix transcriptional regulator [Spirosoma daeguense]
MTINDKIKQILIDKNLTPSYFADEIGVQRSSISHILSGRNRPSFDIIQKIIRRFPELGYEWIMEEENTQGYSTNRTPNRSQSERRDQFGTTNQFPFSFPSQSTGARNQRNEIPATTPTQLPANQLIESVPSNNSMDFSTSEKRVERILIFYTDGSFREYTPTT